MPAAQLVTVFLLAAVSVPACAQDPPLTAEAIMARVAANPSRHGSWFYFPKAKACRFEGDEMIVVTPEGHPLIAFRPLAPNDSEEIAAEPRGDP